MEKKAKLSIWQERLNDLEAEIKYVERETQFQYQIKIEDLQERLHKLQVRLQAMFEGDPIEWVNGQADFQEKYESLEKAILNTAVRIQNEDENVTLGWLQGYTDERPHNSEGWVEGLGEQEEDSEGWVEGMGEKGPDSKGWAEGYNTRRSTTEIEEPKKKG